MSEMEMKNDVETDEFTDGAHPTKRFDREGEEEG